MTKCGAGIAGSFAQIFMHAETKRATVRCALPYLKPHTYIIYVHISNMHAYIDVHVKHTPTRVCVLMDWHDIPYFLPAVI